jgi:uncharacterized DUF497 family protein
MPPSTALPFEQAAGVFKDPMALTLFDQEQSDDEEDRWITLCLVNGQYYLVAVHTYRDEDNDAITIRLISARHATRHEIAQYQG